MADPMSCPFCDYKTTGEYQIMLHIESLHAEGESPFIVKDDASIAAVRSLYEEDVQYAACPIEGCGEAILLTELDVHIDLHGSDNDSAPEHSNGLVSEKPKTSGESEQNFSSKLSRSLADLDDGEVEQKGNRVPDTQAGQKAAWKDLLNMPDVSMKAKAIAASPIHGARKRLGKSELGPYANEKQMPSWLVKLLREQDGKMEFQSRAGPGTKLRRVQVCPNQMDGIVPVLEKLLQQDPSVKFAYLCHPIVKHVSKLKKEGGFCGYRNIQTLSSFIVGNDSQGHENFDGKVPTIFQIQDFIERAWDMGINAQGRIETGGIRGTRKYIGTPDAQAMFCSLGVSCGAQAFKTKKDNPPAIQLLLQAVERYFVEGTTNYDDKVRRTSLPPIYFQHPGHSMTIVGFEQSKDGSKTLLVFDPMFGDSSIAKLVGLETLPKLQKSPAELLKTYRRGLKYLHRYNEFEILKLTPPEGQSGHVVKGIW